LLPKVADDYIGPSNPVRVLHAFVERLDLRALGFRHVEPAATGRAGYGQARIERELALVERRTAEYLEALPAVVNSGILTQYSSMSLGSSKGDYRLGVRWSTGHRFGLDLSARRADAADKPADHNLMLEGQVRF